MARPGKAIFDVTMMGGWAFAAVLTGLLALTLVDDSGDPATTSDVVATLDNDDSRLLTGTVSTEATGSIENKNPLILRQNESFNPFADDVNQQGQQLRDLIAEVRALKREVSAFHVSTKGLRRENALLKQRLAKLELSGKQVRDPVRVVELPRQIDQRNPIISVQNNQLEVDNSATGSIAPVQTIPSNGRSFDPFKAQRQSQVKVSQEPLNMDLTVEGPDGRMMLPRIKPFAKAVQQNVVSGAAKPKSEIVTAPRQALSASQTAFGLDLGQFISIADLDGAWKEVAISQRALVGDLKPLSRVTHNDKNQLALNLVVGPIQNAAQAATLCAKLKFRGYSCRVSVYQGQALATR